MPSHSHHDVRLLIWIILWNDSIWAESCGQCQVELSVQEKLRLLLKDLFSCLFLWKQETGKEEPDNSGKYPPEWHTRNGRLYHLSHFTFPHYGFDRDVHFLGAS